MRARYGSLRRSVQAWHAKHPDMTAREIAARLHSKVDNVRVTAARLGLSLISARHPIITWTPELKCSLRRFVNARLSVRAMAERMGVSEATLVRGLCEIIRDDCLREQDRHEAQPRRAVGGEVAADDIRKGRAQR
jgi:putative heme degradation protein